MKHIRKNEIGNKYNRLLVLDFSHINERNHLAYWKCQCDCGNIVIVAGSSLRKRNTNSCGCYKIDKIKESRYKDEIGNKFGMLTILYDVGRTEAGKVLWKCKCDCGEISYVPGGDLRSGKVLSCGCNRNIKGELNPRWKDGSSKSKYPLVWTKKLREFIRDLDEHICRFPECNYSDLIERKSLHVHHIDGYKQNCDTKNLISLCSNHHQFVESNNPTNWIDYFYAITGGSYGR